jgi:two-component system, chemotaxis family, protein-glutamate methylesterase/glutaminase
VSTTRQSGSNAFDAVVVVGSQGALRSFQAVLAPLTAEFPAAIVFDLHRGEDFGITEQLLARRSPLPVRHAAEGDCLEPSTVYLAPHDGQLTIGPLGRMRISASEGGTGHRFADRLLASAAESLGPRLIAVVLSGRLDGGARGVREVKRRGGRVIVENPDQALAASMPNAALATGCVDFALPPQAIGNALVAMCAVAGAAELFRVRLNPAVVG